MAKVHYYFVVLLLQYTDNLQIIRYFSPFYSIKYSLAKLECFYENYWSNIINSVNMLM